MNFDYIIDDDFLSFEDYTPGLVQGYDSSKFSTKVKNIMSKTYEFFMNILRKIIDYCKMIANDMTILPDIRKFTELVLVADDLPTKLKNTVESIKIGFNITDSPENASKINKIYFWIYSFIGVIHYFKDKDVCDSLKTALSSVKNVKMDSSDMTGTKLYNIYYHNIRPIMGDINETIKEARRTTRIYEYKVSAKGCKYAVSNLRMFINLIYTLNRRTLYYYKRNKHKFVMGDEQIRLMNMLNIGFIRLYQTIVSVSRFRKILNKITEENKIK